MFLRRTLSLLAVGLFAAAAPLRAQGDNDIIRGRVIGPDKKPVENATVTATSLTNQTSRTVKTNKDGRFSIIFSGGGGDYMMSYLGIGFQPMRFEVRREVDEDILVADATLGKSAVTLDAMQVNGGREKPGRDGNSLDAGGREQTLNTNNIPIDILGDLSAMAATLPGITMITAADGTTGFSVLGLSSDQNNITLNGLNFGSTDLPRDATTQTRVTTSSFDPSRGGFSGAQIALRTNSGTNYQVRSLHQTVDAPSLQYTDPVGRELGQRFTNLQLSGNASGPITFDKAFYSFSWQLGRRSSNLQDLLNTDPLAFERLGVSSDSVEHLLNLLNGYGIPVATSAIPSEKLTENGSFLTSFDFAPSGGHTYDITMSGRWNGQDGTSLQQTAVPIHGGDTRSYGGAVQAKHTAYFFDNFLNSTSFAVQDNVTTGDPYVELPSATVRVNSDFNDGTPAGVSSLLFGGSTSLPRNSNTFTSELQNELSWISLDNKHRYKFGIDLRYNRYSQDNTTNRFGTFTYNSISDLQDGIPFSFTRRLQVNRRLGDDLGASGWIGDAYRPVQRLQVTYGLRVDASHFQGNPQFNPAIDSAFGQRNDAVPRGVYFSPRLGFSWTYGTNPQIGGFEGAARGSRGQISGGIGQFQNLPNSTLIAGAVDQTGLPGAAQQLSCVGTAVPVADWQDYLENTGSIPSECADNTEAFTSTAPNVTLFAPWYVPQRSWRANLNWNAPILNNRLRMTSGATYSLNLHQQSQIDLNFDQTPRFTLPGEDNRPVYVNPSSIYPTTGAIISKDARVSQNFAQVTDYLSDMQSRSRQLSLGFSPVAFNSSFQWNVTYVWQRVDEETRGFAGGNTANDPYLTQWARSSNDYRHQITYNIGYTLHQAVSFTAFGRVQSGSPFTPMVSGDVNGDGYNNDRAFIYDPATAPDTAVSNGMKNLLSNAPSSVRSCLDKQIGTIAGRNSCQAPWFTTLSLRIALVSQALKIPDRATISLGIANPLTGLDALIHGSSNLHGWGAPSVADPNLLYVRGFDETSQRYIYEVNPRFGSSRQASAAVLAPMQLTLDVKIDIAPERERQDLFLRLRTGRGGKGNKMSEQQLKQMYMRSYPNPFEQMLRQADSLKLSDDVADSIALLNKTYGRAIDSLWTPVAKYLAALPDKYDLSEAYDRVSLAENKSIDLMAIYGPAAKHLLTDEQVRKLPPFIALFLDNQALRNIRPGRAGGGRGGFFGS